MRCLFWVPENDVATLLQHHTAAGIPLDMRYWSSSVGGGP